VDRYIVSFAAAAMIAIGVAFALWPAGMIVRNRDAEEKSRPPTAGEVLRARLLGLVLIAGGGYFLYAMWTGMPGAEFFPV
jgi:hypothetical protein